LDNLASGNLVPAAKQTYPLPGKSAGDLPSPADPVKTEKSKWRSSGNKW
jgi:hypothetical protein